MEKIINIISRLFYSDSELVYNLDLFNKEDIDSISRCCAEYRLVPWIKEEKLKLHYLYGNPNAIHYLERIGQYPKDKIDWREICHNRNARHIIEETLQTNPKIPDKSINDINEALGKKYIPFCKYDFYRCPKNIDEIEEKIKVSPEDMKYSWNPIYANPDAIHIIEKYIETLDWKENSVKYHKENPDGNYKCIDDNISYLCLNPNAIHILEEKIELLTPCDWQRLCRNPNAVHILEEKFKYTFPCGFAGDLYQNPNAVRLIEEILRIVPEEYRYWAYICKNPSTLHLIKQKMETEGEQWIQSTEGKDGYWTTISSIPHYNSLLKNPSIFELEKMNKEIFKNLKCL
jgi:hypothetical protein